MNQSWQLLTASKTITIHSSQSEGSVPMGEYNPHRGIVNSAVYNHTSKVIASCGQDGKIALHSAIRCTDKLLQLVYHSGQEEPSSINCCLFSPRSKYIAAGSVNSTVKIWDMKANKQKQAIRKLKGHTGAVTSIGWINNEQLIASSSTSGDILLHDVLTGAIRDSLGSKLQQCINNIKVSEGQAFKRLAACTNSGSIIVWDVNASTKKPVYTYEDPKKSSFTCVSISSFKPVLMACSSIDSNIIFMDIQDRKIIKTILTQEPLTSIAFNEDGQILAAGGMNGGLMIYDLRKMQSPTMRLTGHDTPIKSVCFGAFDKQKEKDKNKSRQYLTSNVRAVNTLKQANQSATQIQIDKQTKQKTLTPVVSVSRLTQQQQQKNANQVKVRNLAKKQEIQPIVATSIQPISQISAQGQPTATTYVQSQIQPQTRTIQSNSVINNPTTTIQNRPSTYQPSSTSTYQGNQPVNITYSNPTYGGQQTGNQSQLRNLQQKMIGQMKNMEMRFNQKFQTLHLQVIRQMQLSVEKMSQCFQRSFNYQKQLQNKVKQLQQENENLRKRTF